MSTATAPKSAKEAQRVIEITPAGVAAISLELRTLLADVFALYVKTRNFHWHLSGPHFRDYHLMLDEHADQIFAMTDVVAERTRKLEEPRSAQSVI